MSKNKVVHLFLGIVIFSLMLTATIIIALEKRTPNYLDLLVVWGWGSDESTETRRQCYLWFFSPITQESSLPIIRNDGRCSYDIAMIDGVERLISWEEHPNGVKVAIYDFSNWREITIEKTIHFGFPAPNHISQQDREGYIYYSAFQREKEEGTYHEQIYRVRLDGVSQPELFIRYEDGIVADPIVSPDGQYIAYWSLEGPKNRFPGECGLGCTGYYHLLNIVTHESIELYSLVVEFADRPDTVHCRLRWSPSSRFVAFNLGGCGHMRNEGLVVFDLLSNQVTKFIKSIPGHTYPTMVQWISDTELLYRYSVSTAEIEAIPTWIDKLQIYSIPDHAFYESVNLPFITETDYIFYRIEDLNLTQDSHFLAAQTLGYTDSGKSKFSLVIIDIAQQLPVVNNFAYYDRFSAQPNWVPFENPQWSYSGEWIAFRSSFSDYYDEETGTSASTIYVANKNATSIVEVDTTHLRPHPRYAWLTLSE